MINPKSLANLKPNLLGEVRNPGGKPIAAKNKLSNAFLNAMIRDFEESGESAIRASREKDPTGYLRVIAAVIPKDFNLNDGQNALERIFDNLSDEQLAAFTAAVRMATGASITGKAGTKAKAAVEPTGVH